MTAPGRTIGRTMAGVGEPAPAVARIGPNAVIRLAESLEPTGAGPVFAGAGLLHHLATPPDDMVDERDVVALYQSLARLHPLRSEALAADAGRRTGDYLLANRIPPLAQAVLRRLPRQLASRLLMAAVARHAWTFAGSGHLSWTIGRPLRITIRGGPLALSGGAAAIPLAAFYRATFERLWRALVDGRAAAVATVAPTPADPTCRFDLVW